MKNGRTVVEAAAELSLLARIAILPSNGVRQCFEKTKKEAVRLFGSNRLKPSQIRRMVEPRGIEPLTFAMPLRRSPS